MTQGCQHVCHAFITSVARVRQMIPLTDGTPCPGACSLCHPRQHMRCVRPVERPPHPYPSRLALADHGPGVVSPAQPCAMLHSARSGSLSNAGGAEQLIPPVLTRVFTVMACPPVARSCGLARPRSALVTTVLCATQMTAGPSPEMRLHLHGLSPSGRECVSGRAPALPTGADHASPRPVRLDMGFDFHGVPSACGWIILHTSRFSPG
jgi:hypothetical protein